jgi:hypothetical protein
MSITQLLRATLGWLLTGQLGLPLASSAYHMWVCAVACEVLSGCRGIQLQKRRHAASVSAASVSAVRAACVQAVCLSGFGS